MAKSSFSLSDRQIKRLKDAMERKGITQVSLSIRTHVARSNISRLLKGEPAYESTLEAVCREILDISWREFSDSEISTSGSPHNIPEGGVREGGFFGRDLTSLHQKLTKPGRVRVTLSGMGGVGKTELAIQYARQNLQAYPGGICWLVARAEDSNEVGMSTQIISFAQSKLKLKIPFDAPNSLQRCIDNWDTGDVLFIFDDVEKFDSKIKEILNLLSNSRFKVLVTTRLKLRDPFTLFDVDVLDRSESIKLLQWLSERQGVSQECADSQKLCSFLGDLPLGIELAGRFLAIETGISISIFLNQLEKYTESSKALSHEAFQGDSQEDPAWSLTAQRGLEAAFNLTWLSLDKETQIITMLIGRFPPNSFIHWDVVRKMRRLKAAHTISGVFDDEYNPENVHASKKKLINFNLLKPTGYFTYRLHSLIREFFRSKVINTFNLEFLHFNYSKTNAILEDYWFVKAVEQELNSLHIEWKRYLTVSQIQSVAFYIEYLVYVAISLEDYLITREDVHLYFYAICSYYHSIGQEQLGNKFLDSWKLIYEKSNKNSTSEHYPGLIPWRNTTRKQSMLADTFVKNKQFDEAVEKYHECLRFVKKTLSSLPQHPSYFDSDIFEQEKFFLREYLVHYLKLLGGLHIKLENYALAKRILLKALDLGTRLHKTVDHRSIGYIFDTLATLYEEEREYLLAEESLEKSLEITRKIAGEDSPLVVDKLFCLVLFYDRRGLFEKAIKYAYEGAELSIKALLEGKLTRLLNMLIYLHIVPKISDPEKKYIDFKDKAEKDVVNVLKNHSELEERLPQNPLIMRQVADAFYGSGEYLDAIKFLKLALQICIVDYGESDSLASSTNWFIGANYFFLHKYEEVIEYSLEAVRLCKKYKDRPGWVLLWSLLNLASLHMYISRDALIEVRRDIVEVMKLAPELESNLSGIQFYLVGCAFHSMDDYINSLEAYKKALPLTINEFGEENSQTFSIYEGIAFSLLRLKKYDESVEYYDKVLELSDKYKSRNYPIQLRVLQALFDLFEVLEKDDIILKSKLIELLKLAPELEETLETRTQLRFLGSAFFSVGDYINSLKVLTNLLSLAIDELGEMSSEVVITYFNLGENLFFLHRFEESRTFLKKAITLALEVLGVENESTKVLQNQYQSLLSQMSSNETKTV